VDRTVSGADEGALGFPPRYRGIGVDPVAQAVGLIAAPRGQFFGVVNVYMNARIAGEQLRRCFQRAQSVFVDMRLARGDGIQAGMIVNTVVRRRDRIEGFRYANVKFALLPVRERQVR
jgi:hypothetical protein